MKKSLVFVIFILCLTASTLWAAKLRINGDNSWVGFINGEQVATGDNWSVASVTEFEMTDGYAVIAVYVHDFEPGASGIGGALIDVILDDGTYIPSDNTWKSDAGVPIADRDDGWETINFDDSGWENAIELAPFGQGAWGTGASASLTNPASTAFWIWAGPNDVADDVYFRKTIGDPPTPVEPNRKITTTWGSLKSQR